MSKNKKNYKETIFISLSIIILLITSILCDVELISIITSICGIIYVFLIGKMKKQAYIFGIINVLLYAYIMYNKNLYLNVIYNALYSAPLMIYGYYNWSKIKEKKVFELSKIKKLGLYLFTFVMTVIIGLIIIYRNTSIQYFDYITSILGVLGIYLMTKKYKEQWLIWNVCNIANVIFWVILVDGHTNNINILIMWIIYSINSIYGTIKWRK